MNKKSLPYASLREGIQGDRTAKGESISRLDCVFENRGILELDELFLIFCADPEMTGHDRAIGADDEFAKLNLSLARIHHAGVYQAEVWVASEFFAVVVHRFLDLDA